MPQARKDMDLRYLVDRDGKRVGVFLPLAEFETLMEDLDDLAVVAERRDEPTIAHDDLLSLLESDAADL